MKGMRCRIFKMILFKKKNYVTHSDLVHFGQSVAPKFIDDREQHLVAGDLTKVDPRSSGSQVSCMTCTTISQPTQLCHHFLKQVLKLKQQKDTFEFPVNPPPPPSGEQHHLLEEEEEAAADQLHLQALLDVAVEQREQLGDVVEGQHQQRHLQLTGGRSTVEKHTQHTDTHSVGCIGVETHLDLTFFMTSRT